MAWDLCSSPPHPRLLLSSVGFVRLRRTLNEFSYFFGALYQNDDREIIKKCDFFSFFSFSFRDQTKAKEEKSMRKEFRDRFFSIFLVALHSARKKFFDEIFMWESRNDSESAWAVCSTYIGETCNLLLRAWAFVKLSLSFSRKSPAYPKWNLRSRQTLNISRKTLSSSSKLIHNRNINFRRSSKHIKRQIRSGTRRASECLIFFSRRRRSLRCWLLPETTSRVLRTSKRQYSADDVSLSRTGFFVYCWYLFLFLLISRFSSPRIYGFIMRVSCAIIAVHKWSLHRSRLRW